MKYYYVKDLSLFAGGEDLFNNYLFRDGNWVPDKSCIVSDRLMGYDPTEDDDSPYKFGNLSIMREIEEISEEEFMRRIGVC